MTVIGFSYSCTFGDTKIKSLMPLKVKDTEQSKGEGYKKKLELLGGGQA
jgi:hypothetical protein